MTLKLFDFGASCINWRAWTPYARILFVNFSSAFRLFFRQVCSWHHFGIYIIFWIYSARFHRTVTVLMGESLSVRIRLLHSKAEVKLLTSNEQKWKKHLQPHAIDPDTFKNTTSQTSSHTHTHTRSHAEDVVRSRHVKPHFTEWSMAHFDLFWWILYIFGLQI